MIFTLVVLIQSCTGQNPVELKKRSTLKTPIKESCSSMVFEGQVLSKKNILSIFDCSGWAKIYPEFTDAIKKLDEKSLNNTFKVFNDSFFSSKNSRKKIYETVAEAESRGEMESLSFLLEREFSKHKIFSFLSKTLAKDQLTLEERSQLWQLLSSSNKENLKTLNALRNILGSFEKNKDQFFNSITDEEKAQLVDRFIIAFNEITKKVELNEWRQISMVFGKEEFPLKEWAQSGVSHGSGTLVEILTKPDFSHNLDYLNRSLNEGITCRNRANTSSFYVNVKDELTYKINSLNNDDKEVFEQTLLHGLTKYIAFTDFCEEKKSQQGLGALYRVLKDAFSLIESSHDYLFLKSIHKILMDDRFKFISFLNSDVFKEIQQLLLDAKNNGRDGELMNSLLMTVADLPDEDLIHVAEIFSALGDQNSKTRSWYKIFVKYWTSLNHEEKTNLMSILGVLVDEDLNSSKTFNFFSTVIDQFPDFSPRYSAILSDPNYLSDSLKMFEAFSGPGVQEELSLFFSNKGFFEVISIMTQDYKGKHDVISEVSTKLEQSSIQYVVRPEALKESQTRICFKELTAAYEQETNYYSLVHSLPPSCIHVLGKAGFVGRIYLWMNSADQFLLNNYQIDDFNSSTGVWSPGMLHFIFSSALKADAVLENGQNRGIKKNLDELHRVLSDERVLSSLHHFSNLYQIINTELSMDRRFVEISSKASDKEINKLISDSLGLFAKNDSMVKVSHSSGDCLDLSKNLGVEPCLTNQQTIDGIVDLARILRRKNEEGNSLIKELISWVHPHSGILLPGQRRHSTDFDEIARFLNDLSNEKTTRPMVYREGNEVHHLNGSILERVEIVIRDISFLDNFYGAYFKNNVADSKNYKNEIIDSEKLLVLMDHSGSVLRGTGVFPKETKLKLKNVRSSYLSLAELAGTFSQSDGSFRSYGDFIQSLLMAIKNSSKKSTQDFNPYRTPNPKIVEGHNGIFLTKVVKMSGLRHMANFIHKRFDPSLSPLKSDLFKKINSRLVGRHKVQDLQVFSQKILDKYLDNDRSQLNLFISDFVSYISSLKKVDQERFEAALIKVLAILSDENLSNDNAWRILETAELAIRYWPEIREIFIKLDSGTKLLVALNNLLDGFLASPEKVDNIIQSSSKFSLMTKKDFSQLIVRNEFRENLSKLLNDFSDLQDFQTNLNLHKALLVAFGSQKNQWRPVTSWLAGSLDRPENQLTFSNLIKIVGHKDSNGYRFKLILDEIFLNQRQDLEKFLTETFRNIELKVD